MGERRFEQVLTAASKMFRPHEIVGASGMSHDQKVKLLKEWEYDLRLVLVASEENMTGDGNDMPADILRQVRKCLANLGADDDERNANPSKVGGGEVRRTLPANSKSVTLTP